MKNKTLMVMLTGMLLTSGSALAGYIWVDDDGTAGEAPAIRNVEEFQEPLAEHGTWFEVESYGRVWQPTVVRTETDWRPYCHGGRWVWSDRGWYWASTYTWGWAPFHYGRWASLPRHGWVWVPDVTWAPSWVEWRSSDSYVGWAPARPVVSQSTTIGFSARGLSVSYTVSEDDYRYVPVTRFSEMEIVPYMMPHHQEERYRCEPPRYRQNDRHPDYDRHEGQDRRGDDDRRASAPAGYEARPNESPRVVDVNTGRRTERLQQLYGQSAPAQTRPVTPTAVQLPPASRPQATGSRAEALQALLNRGAPARIQAPAAGAAVVRKPVTEILSRRNISPEQLRATLEKAEKSPRYAKLAKTVKQQWASER